MRCIGLRKVGHFNLQSTKEFLEGRDGEAV